MPSRAEKVKQLFDTALDLPEAERVVFLADACRGDDDLRSEVQGLLQAFAEASGFLVEREVAATEGPGATIDRYRLLERIGEGGFGVVFRAEQDAPLRREVALKVIKLGMDTRRVVARFEIERRALARMQHPHVATVLDGGTTPSGRPYFVMELVRGQPITRFCREHGLDIEERLGLVQQVCGAVQHAHNRGIVHRDLKPANVLVTADAAGEPVPKVIDFGIAKAVESDDPDDGALTQQGQPLGTLEYMAPEQTDGVIDVDARADVYSLGVMLYELLTGRRPFERCTKTGGSVTGLIEKIRTGAVVRPSACVAAAGAEADLPGVDRRRWARSLRDELDWIVVRALAKEPGRRYPTPAALGQDLQRFLDGRPVEAGPPTALYQLRCFVGRHRLTVAASLLLLLSLIMTVVVTASALGEVRLEAARQERTLVALKSMLLTADPGHKKGHDYTVRQMLDDFAAGLDAHFDADPSVALDLQLTVGAAYRNLGQLTVAEQHLGKAVTIAGSVTGGVGARYEQALHEWSHLMRELGRYGEAERVIDELRALPTGSDDVRLRRQLAKADLRRLHGDLATAEQLAREVLTALAAGRGGDDPREFRAMALDLIGAAVARRGDHAGALEAYEQALTLRRERYGEDHIVLAVSLVNLADTWRQVGEPKAAETAARRAMTLQRRAFGDCHPELARTLSLCGDLARGRGELDEARRCYEEAHAIRLACLPAGHVDLATGPQDLAGVLLEHHDYPAAAAALREALAIRERAGASNVHAYAAALQNLGVALGGQGHDAEAEHCYRRAHELHLRLGGEANPPVADCLQNIATVRQRLGDAGAALVLHEQSLALRERHQPEDLEALLQSHTGIAAAASAIGDGRRAAVAHAARADLLARIPGTHPQRVHATRIRAGREFLDAGQPESARPLIEVAHQFCSEHLPGKWPLGEAASLLAECRLAAGDHAEALRLAEIGVRLLARAPAPEKTRRAEATLARVRAAGAATEDKR